MFAIVLVLVSSVLVPTIGLVWSAFVWVTQDLMILRGFVIPQGCESFWRMRVSRHHPQQAMLDEAGLKHPVVTGYFVQDLVPSLVEFTGCDVKYVVVGKFVR